MISLVKKDGFSIDVRKPRLDGISCYYANRHFGYEYVNRVMEKYHRSVVTHEDIEADFLSYDRNYVNSKVRTSLAYQVALKSVQNEFSPKEKLIPRTLGAVMKHHDFPGDRSPGLPYILKGFKTKREVLEDKEQVSQIFGIWDSIGKGRQKGLPDVAGYFRAQIAELHKNKIRAVWGFPVSVIVEEGRMFYPYLEWIKTTDAPIAYRVEMATGGMAYIDEMCNKFPQDTYLMTDYSNFDKTVPPWLIRDAFSIVLNSFDDSKVQDVEGKVWNVNPIRTQRRWKRLVDYFINTPVRLPRGDRYMKTGGVPSGSMFTNIIDTIINVIVSRYSILMTTGKLPAADMYLGDDAFIIANGKVNIQDIAQVSKDAFGMIINVDKSYTTTNKMNVQFLGYYNRNGLPFKGNMFLVASFIYPERIVKDNETRVARGVGQMWSTMHCGQAYRWHNLIVNMMNDFDFSTDEIEKFIRRHPGWFKYIRILGIPISSMTVPEVVGQTVPAVDPPCVSLRNFKAKKYDVLAIQEQVFRDHG